jgi:hypothetical protein
MAEVDPLSTLTDQQVQVLQVALALACGRSHGTLSHRRQQWFCFLARSLKLEADLRGLPAVEPPYHVSQVPPFSL